MSCDDKNQSAIAETRDQLFLDTADGPHLNVVTSNLGLDRPGIGFGDDEWRAVGKLVSLQPKQIRNIFYRMIELCIGPQYARIGVLEDIAKVNDKQLVAADPSPFIQLGTLIVDPGLVNQETVSYCIRDLSSGTFFLKTALQKDHVPFAPGADLLASTAAAGSGTLTVLDASVFPTTFPFPIIIDRGTVFEETAVVNSIAGNVLTLAGTTTFTHNGPVTLFNAQPLSAAAPPRRTFLQFATNGTRGFPAAGWVRINNGGPHDEVVQYESNDVVNNVLFLKTPLASTHAVGEYVELVTPGAPVEVCQLLETGIHWNLYEAGPRKITVTIPKNFKRLGPLDATWMHGAVPAAFSTTTTQTTATTDYAIPLTSVSGLPHDAAMVKINAGPARLYSLKIAKAETLAAVKTTAAAGVLSLAYTLNATSQRDFPNPVRPFWVIINQGGGTQEIVRCIGSSGGKLTFAAPLANAHNAGEVIQPLDQIVLDTPAGLIFGAALTVQLFTEPYAGFPALEQGNNRDPFGSMQLYRFPGGYIYDANQRGISARSALMTSTIPPIIRVAFTQMPQTTALEVDDASLWPAPPFTPFKVRIGESTGFEEDRTLENRVLKKDATGTTPATLAGITTMAYTHTSTIEFPSSDGVHNANYRVLIAKGTARQETAFIAENDIGTHTFTFVAPLTQPHNLGDTIELLSDVLTFDVITKKHVGPSWSPTMLGHPVHAFISEIDVGAALTGFSAVGGWLWVNFGKEMIDVRKRITTITSPTSYKLSSTAQLPTSGYPYQIILSEGQANEEKVFVTNNNGTDTLTFQAPGAVNTHAVGEYAKFIAGDPEAVAYNATATGPNRVTFSPPVLFDTRHLAGERVMYSPAVSQSHIDGSSYGFKMPPDPSGCLATLFELVRAAGIQVKVLLK